jgi:hypothetical protein
MYSFHPFTFYVLGPNNVFYTNIHIENIKQQSVCYFTHTDNQSPEERIRPVYYMYLRQ